MREADIAIRLHRPNQSEMIQRKLFTVHNHFYASKSYLAENGAPQTVEELDNHRDHHLRRAGALLPRRHQLPRAPRPPRQLAAPGPAQGQRHLRHDAGRPRRHRHRHAARLRRRERARAAAHPHRRRAPRLRDLLRLSRRPSRTRSASASSATSSSARPASGASERPRLHAERRMSAPRLSMRLVSITCRPAVAASRHRSPSAPATAPSTPPRHRRDRPRPCLSARAGLLGPCSRPRPSRRDVPSCPTPSPGSLVDLTARDSVLNGSTTPRRPLA